MLKRFISAAVSLCMVLSLIPMFVAAETTVKLTPLGDVNRHSQTEIINYIKSFDPSDGLVGVSEKATGKGVAYSTTWTDVMKYAQVPSVRAPYSAGSLTGEYQNTALKSLNFIRYLAGLPDDVKISDEYLSIMQQGAVMLNQQFSHTPVKPNDMDKDFYDKAYKANNKGNIGFGMPDLMSTITQGYATDSGMLVPGHRNWILNMYMQYTAFGEAGKASNMYAMDVARKNAPDFDAICYPVSNFPTDFFDTTAAWSIQLRNRISNVEKIQVTLTGNGETWNFSNQSSDDEFKIEPITGGVYFKPKGINGIFYSGEYTVKVTGLETKNGNPAELEYTVNFFDIKPTNVETPQPTAPPTPTATPKPTSTPKPTATPTPTEPAKPLVTIIKQPTSLTVTQGSISGSITMEATSSSGKITYKLKGVGNEMVKAEFKLSPTLPIGVYEYWFGVYLDGKLVMKSDVATVTVLKRDVSSGFLEILPYNRIEQGSLNSYEKVKGKPTVVVFGSSYGCTSPGISAGYKFIKNNLLEGKVNLLAFAYGMNGADAQTAASSGFKADWYTLYNSGSEQMWALLDSNGVNFPVIAYFDDNGNFIRYRTSNKALDNVETDFKEMLDKSGVAIPTPKPTPTPTPASLLVTINKQPAPITMVTEGKITESIAISATASSGKLTYEWAISETDDTPPKGRLTQKTTPEFKLGSLKAGTYYYFCVLYVDGKEALRSNIATIQVIKAEEATATNPETANMKKGINVVSLPTKTTYAIGEGFDTTGAKVVYNTGEKLNDVTANILFYTSKTVQLTEGRPFTTTGEKVVELRQTDGNVIGNYTITVHENGAAAKHPFADVKSGAYYEAPVIWALKNNVTAGTSDTTFSPNDTCTRGQVVTFLWRTKGQPEPTSTYNPFADVNSNDYYYKAVLWAVENGITAGTSDTTFSPNDLCTSAHVVTFLWRAKGKPTATVTNYSGEYFADAVAWADGEGLLSGIGTDFAPNNNSPRADIVTYLYRNAGSPDIQ